MKAKLVGIGIVGVAAAVLSLRLGSERAQRPTPKLAPRSANGVHAAGAPVTPRSRVLENAHAYIPPQCYTKTQGDDGRVYNPCFACHVDGQRPNFVRDADLQLSYAFPAPARQNPWSNLFVDRRAAIAGIGDDAVLAYVRTDNYPREGEAARAADAYIPRAHFAFDERGFDRGPDGSYSGFRAVAYLPFPGTFFPTNGSAGDVLIRLPAEFREDERGAADLDVYALNLAIVESLIKNRDVPIPELDERRYGVDVDRDGALGKARVVRFDWAPLRGRTMSYVGRARLLQAEGALSASAGLFPAGTEFLHTVRYLDVEGEGVRMAPRLKELRYAVKSRFLTYAQLEQRAAHDVKEDHDYPDRLHQIVWSEQQGVSTGTGWNLKGMIEDAQGALRRQSYEELTFCVGCHGAVGATADSTFAFQRKLEGEALAYGWWHPSQRDLAGVPEPRRADGRPEYGLYLERAGGGDELRENAELRARFFDERGAPRAEALAALQRDVRALLLPSPGRALALDKAYWLVVREQSFIRGRDAVLAPSEHVWRATEEDQPTGVEEPETAPWQPAVLAQRARR